MTYTLQHTDDLPLPILPLDPLQASLRQRFAEQQELSFGEEAREDERHPDLILQLLIDGLLQAEDSLLVDDSDQLEIWATRLQEMGLQDHFLLVRDLDADRQAAEQGLGDGKEKPGLAIHLTKQKQQAYQELQSEIKPLQYQYRQSRKAIFGDHSWFSLLGNFLSAVRQNPRALIDSRLDPKSFSFQPEEFAELLEDVSRMQLIYRGVGTLQHPLRHLKSAIFLHFSEEEAFLFVDLKVAYFLREFADLFHRLITYRTRYADRLLWQWESQFREWYDKITNISQLIDRSVAEVGHDYLNSKSISLQMSGLLSEKSRKGLRYKRQIEHLYTDMQKDWLQQAIFVHRLPDWKQSQPLRQLQKIIQSFWKNWQAWYQHKEDRLRDELNRLNQKTAQSGLNRMDQLSQLEEEFDDLVALLNDTELLELPLRGTMLTLDKRLRLLEDTIAQLSEIQRNLPQFQPFYHWQRSLMEQAVSRRRLFIGLARSRSQDWRASFQAWYWRECLRHNLLGVDNQADSKLTDLSEAFAKSSGAFLQKLQKDYFQQKRISKKKKGAPAKEKGLAWWKKHRKKLHNRYPIWLVSRQVVEHLFTDEKKSFKQLLWVDRSGANVSLGALPAAKKIRCNIVSKPGNQSKKSSDFRLSNSLPANRLSRENNAFYEELALRLQSRFPTAKILTEERQGGISLPLVLMRNKQADCLILADAYLAETPQTNFVWEAKMQEHLKNKGYHIIATSTQQWWQHPKLAWQKLLEEIGSKTEEEE